MGGSKVFSGYQAFGFVSNHIPLSLRYSDKNKKNYVITVIGRTFNVYDSARLTLFSTGKRHDLDISYMTSDCRYIYTAAGKLIYAWTRGKDLRYTYRGHDQDVHYLMPFAGHLLSVDTDSTLKVWDITTQQVFLELTFDKEQFSITCMVHPSTYLNKVLIGSKQGGLQLWNIKTSKLVYTFHGWNSSICVLEQAPAVDVTAIGLASGEIIIHNIKFDKTLMKFYQEWGPVTALSFRTDSIPILASASTVGHVALWNLEEKRLQSQIRDAHCGAVTGMKFLLQEPILVTSSPDNSLKMWIFDLADGGGRLLRFREGHHAPPIKIRFYDRIGYILSAGLDSRLQSFSTMKYGSNKSLGQASMNRKAIKKTGLLHDPQKMPPIVDFAAEKTREKEWDNIAACHRGLNIVTTWSYDRSCMGEHKLLHERFKMVRNVVALCVTISACGNFVVIGYNTGHVDRYNIQSGIFRQSYGKEKAHEMSVRGVATDALNQFVVTGGSDNLVKFWRFTNPPNAAASDASLLSVLDVGIGVSQFVLHRESSMLAVGLDNFDVVIIDLETRSKVRTFASHQSRVTDMCFSVDARWLITATMDCRIWVWDLPSGRAVDCFLVASPCTSLTMSFGGDFLATSHADDLGIYLWSNKTLYTPITLMPLPLDFEPTHIQMPAVAVDTDGDAVQASAYDNALATEEDGDDVIEYVSPEQINDRLVTLSLMPNSHWQNLLNLDIIKQRNKPKEPVSTPKTAPFFLPTIAGLQPKFAIEDDGMKEQPKSRILDKLHTLSPFGEFVLQCQKNEDYLSIISKLKTMGPSKIDSEIRCLSPDYGGSIELMDAFMKAILISLKTNQNYELTHSYLALFLQIHGEFISSSVKLCELAEEISQTMVAPKQRIQKQFNQIICLTNYLRSAVLQ